MDVRRRAPVDRYFGDLGLAAGEGAGLALDPAAEVIGGQEDVGRPDGDADEHQENTG